VFGIFGLPSLYPIAEPGIPEESFTGQLFLKVNGQQVFIRNDAGLPYQELSGMMNWTYILTRSEELDSFHFDLVDPCFGDGTRYVPDNRDEIVIYQTEADMVDNVRWFGGLLIEVKDEVLVKGEKFFPRYTITAQSFEVILEKELRQPRIIGKTWEALIQLILERHFSEQLEMNFDFIDCPIGAPPVRLVNGSLRQLLKVMRNLTGYDFKVDAYQRVHVFKAEDRPIGFTLNDSPALGLTVYETRPTVSFDARNIFNIVRQPYDLVVEVDDWEGEIFTGKGDPKGNGGILPLLRTPRSLKDTIFISDKFDSDTIDEKIWLETDTETTEHEDFPNQGFLFATNGQLQVVGGTGAIGGVALVSKAPFEYREASYIAMEFQLTSDQGAGFIGVFTDGEGLQVENFKAGLKIVDGELRALDDTVLVAMLEPLVRYFLWITQTEDGWQYDIQGGAFGTKQTLHTEEVAHLTDYLVAPVLSVDIQCSFDSFQYRLSDHGVILEIDGEKKVVGLEATDVGLPNIDAFLNVDETPALLKFKAAVGIAIIQTVNSDTEFTVDNSSSFRPGQRLLIGDSVVEEFNGREAWVEDVNGNTVTLQGVGLADLTPGQVVLVDTTVPAKDQTILVRYSYTKRDEATVADDASVDKYGPFPLTLGTKDHISTIQEAQAEAEAHLKRFKEGITKVSFNSNSSLLKGYQTELDTRTTLPVNLTKRAVPIERDLIVQRLIVVPVGQKVLRYTVDAESADPVKPLDEIIKGRELVIGSSSGSDDTILLSASPLTEEASDAEDIVIREVSSIYITWANPEQRKWGEAYWMPSE
jgi:hypothetical protein